MLPGGMTTVVGRIRRDSVLENGVKWVFLFPNTKLGAARGAISVAEHLLHTGQAQDSTAESQDRDRSGRFPSPVRRLAVLELFSTLPFGEL